MSEKKTFVELLDQQITNHVHTYGMPPLPSELGALNYLEEISRQEAEIQSLRSKLKVAVEGLEVLVEKADRAEGNVLWANVVREQARKILQKIKEGE